MKNKLHGCGNSFLIIDEFNGEFIRDRKRFVEEIADGEGVDGVLFLRRSEKKDVDLEMRIFDRDGTEESMCGNGIRCFARYSYDCGYIDSEARILTGDGIKNVEIVRRGFVRVSMGNQREFKEIDNEKFFLYTGVPHLVYFRENLDKRYSEEEGRRLRHDKNLGNLVGHEDGININFIKVVNNSLIENMTYEVGVENVTQACGTGSTAAAYVAYRIKGCKFPIVVRNLGGDLIIDFKDGQLFMTGGAEYL